MDLLPNKDVQPRFFVPAITDTCSPVSRWRRRQVTNDTKRFNCAKKGYSHRCVCNSPLRYKQEANSWSCCLIKRSTCARLPICLPIHAFLFPGGETEQSPAKARSLVAQGTCIHTGVLSSWFRYKQDANSWSCCVIKRYTCARLPICLRIHAFLFLGGEIVQSPVTARGLMAHGKIIPTGVPNQPLSYKEDKNPWTCCLT